MKKVFLLICISFQLYSQNKLQTGDIIFIENKGGQGRAIQLATKSNWTHVGIIFIENGKTYVYHAVNPVSKNTLEEFLNLSYNHTYKAKRPDSLKVKLNAKQDALLLKEALKHLNKPYDYVFSWSDAEWYCSEYVWKLYQRIYNIEIGDLKELKDYDLSNPIVKDIMTKRYGSKIPYHEKMISPGEMFDSNLLVDIK